ncbi:MAG: biotin-dependent carboxyltransferase family protein [Planctomycetota bacterium]|nr:biotin-dependent carboxyltransferase family protein [Planctomycetota bacterium]
MSALEILDPGLQSLIQDTGRIGYTRIGVPPGGAADCLSLRCANELVGNPAGAAAIEMAMLGLAARARVPLTICLAGASAPSAFIESANGTRDPLPALTPRLLFPGASLHIGRLTDGLRTYLEMAGDIDTPHVLSSASTLLSASMGGFQGRALRRGDLIRIAPSSSGAQSESLHRSPVPNLAATLHEMLRPPRLRIVPGLHASELGWGLLRALQQAEFKVENQSNRVGLRLKPEEAHAASWAHELGRIASVGMTYGAIEIPQGGSPIILGPDHPTTGGYPVLACIIAADLPALGQLGPGDAVRFELVSHEAARAAYVAQQQLIDRELHPS